MEDLQVEVIRRTLIKSKLWFLTVEVRLTKSIHMSIDFSKHI